MFVSAQLVLSLAGFLLCGSVAAVSSVDRLQSYYVTGELNVGYQDPFCQNASDTSIFAASSFLNCTAQGHLINITEGSSNEYSWNVTRNIDVWLVFSEPVVIQTSSWTFLKNDQHSPPIYVNVATVSESSDRAFSATDVSQELLFSTHQNSAANEVETKISLKPNDNLLEPTKHWKFEIRESETTGVALSGICFELQNLAVSESAEATSTVSSLSPTQTLTSTTNPSPMPSVQAENTPMPENNTWYYVVGALGGVIIVLILVVILVIFFLVCKTSRRSISIRSGKNSPAQEVIYSDPELLSPPAIDISKDPAYSGSTGSNPYDEPQMLSNNYSNFRSPSPVYAEPDRVVNERTHFHTLPTITVLSTGSDPALCSPRSRFLTLTSQSSGSELKGSMRSLMSVPLGHASTSSSGTGQDHTYHSLDGFESSSGDESGGEDAPTGSNAPSPFCADGYAILEDGESDGEEETDGNVSPPFDPNRSRVVLVSDSTDTDSRKDILPESLSNGSGLGSPCAEDEPVPTQAQLDVELLYTKIDITKKTNKSQESLHVVNDDGYAEPSLVGSPSVVMSLDDENRLSACSTA